MSFKKSVVLLLTVAVFACFGGQNIVVDGKTIELTEIGEELATKAASLYAEELYSGSPLGSAEPVYMLPNVGDGIMGWLYIIDTSGEKSITHNEYEALTVELQHHLFESELLGDGKREAGSTTAFRVALQDYNAILISNYREYTPLLYNYNSVPGTHIERSRYILKEDYEIGTDVLLYGCPGWAYVATCFSVLDGARIFSEFGMGNYKLLIHENDIETHTLAQPLFYEESDNNVRLWDIIENSEDIPHSNEKDVTHNWYLLSSARRETP